MVLCSPMRAVRRAVPATLRSRFTHSNASISVEAALIFRDENGIAACLKSFRRKGKEHERSGSS